MTPEDPHTQTPGDPTSGEPGPATDPLEELTERVRAAQAAAERLMQEAAQAAREEPAGTGARRPPPRGWASPGTGEGPVPGAEAQALAALLELGRSVLPPELRRQFGELMRELLLLVRSVIDWYLERLDGRRREAVEVEDIPIA